jgi:hypothetical protein
MTSVRRRTMPDGDYTRSCSAEREFFRGEFIVEGVDVRTIDLNVEFAIHLKRPAVLSHFEINGRGRVITFEGYNFNGVTFSKSEFVCGIKRRLKRAYHPMNAFME